MALRTPDVLRLLEEIDDDTIDIDGEEPMCEGSDDDLGMEISDGEEKLVDVHVKIIIIII